MLPLVTITSIINELKKAKTGFEIFDEYPTTMENVRHGIYVNDPAQSAREPYQLGLTSGSSIYRATDSITIKLVSFQDDVNRLKAILAIQNLVDSMIMDGYHERTFTMSEEYLNRAEYRTYEFSLTRLDFSPNALN